MPEDDGRNLDGIFVGGVPLRQHLAEQETDAKTKQIYQDEQSTIDSLKKAIPKLGSTTC